VKAYFQILVDTLLGRWVPAYRRRPKRRTVAAPKFYFTEVGTVNVLAKRGPLEPGSAAFGKAFETWVCHELAACLAYHEHTRELSYWRLTTGSEVDFVVGDMHVAIEAKATARVTSDHLKGLRAVAHDYPEVSRRLVVCLEPRRRRTEDGIDILPVRAFTEALWQGELLGPAGS
jgi:predicted AAA+ superfamily ATPase